MGGLVRGELLRGKTMEILIKSEKTTIEKTAKGTELRKQQAAIDQGNDYPLPFKVTVQEPYKPGRYTLHPDSFRVTPFQTLELNPYNTVLIPV